MLVSDAARRMGVSTQTLRLGLRQRLFPFGEAILTSEHRYTYFISDERFERYMKGADLNGNGNSDTTSRDRLD